MRGCGGWPTLQAKRLKINWSCAWDPCIYLSLVKFEPRDSPWRETDFCDQNLIIDERGLQLGGAGGAWQRRKTDFCNQDFMIDKRGMQLVGAGGALATMRGPSRCVCDDSSPETSTQIQNNFPSTNHLIQNGED